MMFLKSFFLIGFSGCFTQERFNENMYEGLKTRERFKQQKNPENKYNIEKDVSYYNYKRDINNTKF